MAGPAKKMITPVKVGVFVVAAVVAFAAFLQVVSTRGIATGDSYRVYAHFRDVLGLEKKSPVQIAGIDVGAIESIVLEEGQAKLTLRIKREVKLFEDARLEKVSISLLGDYKLAINPGDPSKRQLQDGDWITNVQSLSDTEQIIAEVRKVADSMSKLISGTPENPAPLELIVRDVQGSAAAARKVIEVVSENIGENSAKLDQILSNIERFTTDLREISAGKEADITAITKDAREIARSLKATSQALEQIIAGQQEADLKESVKSLKQTLENMNKALERIASITEKIDEGQGTVGALVNDEGMKEDLKETVDGLNTFVGGLTGLQTWVNLRSEFQFRTGAAKNYVQIRLVPREDKWYLIELVDDPRGVRRTVIEDVETTSPEQGRDFVYRERRTITETTGLKFSLQFAKRLYFLALRFGIVEGTGGVGLNLYALDDRFELLIDANRFGEDARAPRFKALAQIELIPHIYLHGGIDDFFNPGTTDFFFGAGVKFNDEDLRYLLFTLGGLQTNPGGK